MLKKYPSIYSLQLIHGRQARQVYADKANEKANLLADSCTKTAFDRSRQERITSIIGPIGTGEARHSLAVCKPIFIKGKFWGYATALYKEKRLFKPTFNKLDKLGYNYRLSKTFITGGGYQPLSSNLPSKSQSEITFRLGDAAGNWRRPERMPGRCPRRSSPESSLASSPWSSIPSWPLFCSITLSGGEDFLGCLTRTI